MPNVESLREGDPAAVGPYRLVGRLGAGGHGVVYLGQARNGTPVAVKVLHEGLAGGDRLTREIAAARRVEPFCLAQVLDASASGRPYIVAEYVDGPSLQRAGRVGGAELQRLAVATATALDALHQAGVVHLNLKPANVVLGPDGARVVDFGIARAFGSGLSGTGNVVGTPAYMAPEQVAGQAAGTPADVFAWASVMVFAATGVPPFGDGSLAAVINRILREEPELGDLPRPLREVVPPCLAKDPAARPAMRDVLLRLIGGEQQDTAGSRRLSDARQSPASASFPLAAPVELPLAPDQPSAPAGHPASGRRPVTGEQPAASGHPAATEHPAAFRRAAATEHPASGRRPVTGEQPAASGHPAATDRPAASGRAASAGRPAGPGHPAPDKRLITAEHSASLGHSADGPGAGEPPAGVPMPAERSALVDVLVAGEPSAGKRAPAARSGRRRMKTVLIAVISAVSVLALAGAIVWLTPTTPTPKAETVTVTGAPTSEAATTPTQRPRRTRTARPTPQSEGTPSIVPTEGSTSAAGRLRVASLRAGGTRNGDCWAGGEVTLQALVTRTGASVTFGYAWIIDGVTVSRRSAAISENGQRYLASPRNLTGAGAHTVTLRITSPVAVQRSISVTLCDGL
ncbi:protein kinase domain-containing protein [Nonomuraea sp. H19]|uniref:serine/threonine protein kinase n=1 Tax=Nonomuraea sp. H19 TaxID=3452206 RepID=UPI003F8B7104